MKLAVLVLSVLALIIVGCGSSDEDSLSKAEFIKQADALCKKADEREAGEYVARARSNPSEFESPNGEGKEKAIREILVPSIQKQVDDMKALGLPEGDEEQLEKFFEAVESALEEIEEEPLSVEESREKSPLYGSFKIANAYGFKSCREMY